jgi:hypothetical protein
MKKFMLNVNTMGSLSLGFLFGVLAVFTISPFHFDAVDGICTDSLLAMDLFIKEDTFVKDPATGKEIPFSELKSVNPKLSSSLNQLLSARKHSEEFRVNAFAKERGMKLKDDLIQVVIEINADSHKPLSKEIIEEARDRIIHAGGKFEVDFHNRLQVLLPVEALEEAASWPEVKFIREPLRPHPIKDGSGLWDQSEGNLPKSGRIQPDPSNYEQIPEEQTESNENFLRQGMCLKQEIFDSAYAEVYFCTEYNCSSTTVTLGGQTHTSKLKCGNILGFQEVPPGAYSYKAIGCGSTWGGNLNVEAGYQYIVSFCPMYSYDCCPIGFGCGSEGAYLCAKCISPESIHTSEGVNLILSDEWKAAGHKGAGTKIAVIDSGFQNYSFLLGKELPDSVTTQFYGSGEDVYGTVHGTACAEIIYDMAPDAQLFFTQPRTDVELSDAVNWCLSQGVQVISYSMGWSINAGPIDGTGPVNDIVNQAINHGITWVNSAGNEARSHWSSHFYDPDGDGFANFDFDGLPGFGVPDETNDLYIYGEEKVIIGMIWDDPWGASCNDYDLYVFRLDDFDLSSPVAYSTGIQDGDDDPSELITFTPQSGISYGFAIKKKNGIAKNIHVTLATQNPLEYQVPETSICIPADNPNVIATGAVAWNSPSVIENFSSRGPTTDGRIKPDLVAPDRVTTYSYYPNQFPGTSASCPHVAGACALVKQARQDWSPSRIKDFLGSGATDLGSPGKDNTYGSGLVHLSGNAPENGWLATNDLWIRAVINTVEKGPIEALWQKGGEDTTSRGDRVVWGHFYASPSDVTWGSQDNPDLFVKIWFDVSGRIDVNYFHVSVPDIEVYSDYPYDGMADEHGITTMSGRYIRQYYENGQCHSEDKYEDGNPPSGCTAMGNPSGYSIINDLRIGSIINTVEKGPIDAVWRFGGQDTTARGDQVVWGHFYASPSDVNWGSQDNPDLFVKIWFDVSGRVDVNFFHVSVPDIEVYSDLPDEGTYDQKGTTIMDNRYIMHEY